MNPQEFGETVETSVAWSPGNSTVATVSGREDPMGMRVDAGREFWRGVLIAGGFERDPAVDLRSGDGRRGARGDDPR